VHKLVPLAPLAREIGEENIYFFAYNAFEDPYETAKKLDEYIANVRKEKECEKVNLLTFSMGGAVCTAYLDEYGKKGELNAVFYVAAALYGSQMQSDILNRNFDKKQGYSLLEFFTSKSAGDAFRKVLAFVPWEVRYGVLYRSFDAVIDTAMLNSVGMWALQPVEDYQALADRFLSDEKYAALRRCTDRFFSAQCRLKDIISEMQSRGVSFYCAAGYGLRMLPLSAAGDVSSDSILSVYSSSLGATSAKLGEKLTDTDGIISPDGSVDASTCFLRDTTWLFGGLSHREMSHDMRVGEIIKRAFTDSDFNVYSDKSFPRFM
ncbi:MAG: hypothetical protein MJ177_10795, partial [Clostridia bacterium]|nr:hypothetical protein [Clostridia bacterium]